MATHSPCALAFIYPHTSLTKIVGKPSYGTLQKLLKEVYANARTIYSTRGGGNNGHLALVMPDSEYRRRTAGVPFEPPTHPGKAPTTGALITMVEFEAAHKIHVAKEKEFQVYTQVGASLKAQLLATIESTYTNALEDPMFGFADITPLDIMAHLRTVYGQLKPDDRGALRKTL
jgi:hypothetical protein